MSYSSEYADRLKRLQALAQLGVTAQTLNRPASKTDLANLILQKARSDFSVSGPASVSPIKKDKSLLDKGKGFALGVLDVLSRPSYAVAEASDVAFNGKDNNLGDVLKGFGRGISGKDQTSFIDVLQHQHTNEITTDDPEYQRILKDYGQKEADYYKGEQERLIQGGRLQEIGPGLFTDFVLDPLNAVGKIPKAVKGLSEVARGLSKEDALADAAVLNGSQAATGDVPGVLSEDPKASDLVPSGASYVKETLKPQTDSISPSILSKLLGATETPTKFPSVSGKFASNRRPPVKTVEGKTIKADYSGDISKAIQEQPRFATLNDVFNKDITPQQFEGLGKARAVNETAQIVDQAAKSNPAALSFLKPKDPGSLTPVARQLVDDAVLKIQDEIKNSIADPLKARAAGKQPRHPVFNAPTQSNLSNKLTNSARAQFQKETPSVKGPASPRLIPAVYSRYITMLRNAEETMIMKGRELGDDSLYPRGGNKPDSPYIRLSDVLDRLPREIAQNTILGPKGKGKVLPSVLLRAVTGDKKALGIVARDNRELSDAIRQVDWGPVMTRDYALRVIDATNRMQPVLDESADLLHQAKSLPVSDSERAFAADKVQSEFKKEFKYEMPSVKGAFAELLSKMANPKENIVEQILNNRKSRLAAGVSGSKNGQKVAQGPRIDVAAAHIEEVTGETAKVVGLSPELADKAAESGIFSTLLSWIKPDYGYEQLRPTVIKNVSVRKASAAVRASNFTKILNMVPVGEHMTFWKETQGFLPVAPAHAEAVQLLQRVMGNMFGESGLLDKFAGNSSVARAGISVADLNKHLRIAGIKDFQFTKEAKDPLTGKMVKFDGPMMLQTWRNYIPKSENDLRQFIFGLSQATENAMVEYSAFASMGAQWGSKTAKNGFIKVSDMHPAIDGLHFPKDIVSQIGKFSRGIDEFYEPLANNKLLSLYDSALRTWKSGVTIYAPSHHVRNMTGDMFLAWLDGVSNPVYYHKAGRVMLANHGHYSDIDPGKKPLKDLLGEGREAEILGEIMGQSKTRIPKGSGVIVNPRVSGKRYQVTIDQVYEMAFRHGLLPHSNVIEDMPGSETLMETLANKFHPGKAGPFQPFAGKVQKGAREVSESREHYARLAHYLYALEHTPARSLEDLFEKSAQRVRKYHPDGLDLTTTEKRVLRRLFPFYAWTRKAIPLIAEGVVTNPAKIMAYPKFMSGMQELQGQDSSVSDPWPEDQLFPDWLAGNVIGPTFDPQSALSKALARSDDEVGYTVINPGNPATDILEDYGNSPIKGIGNSITPFLKIPAEIGFGTEFMSGAPIKDKTEYVDKNVPILSTVSRLTNGAIGSGLAEGGDLKGKETSGASLQAILNYLTGAGIMDTGRHIKGGEFDLRSRIAEQKKGG